MANNLSGSTMKIIVEANQAKAVDVFGTPAVALQKSAIGRTTVGSGAGLANLLYTRRLVLAGAGAASIDLAGALVDSFGDAAVFAKVKGLLIDNLSDLQAVVSAAKCTVTGNFLIPWVGGGATNPPTIPIEAGEWIAYQGKKTGITVTGGTGDTITVTNNDATASCTVDIVVLGNA